MTLHGKILNGVIVLEGGIQLPEGTEVAVFVPRSIASHEVAPLAEQQRGKAALAELLALPDENPGDTFSGAEVENELGRHDIQHSWRIPAPRRTT